MSTQVALNSIHLTMSEIKTNLVKYQNFIRLIREFFYSRKIVEVKTPSLLSTPTSDVYIDSIGVEVNDGIQKANKRYLHTSPEIEMKRLLLKGSGDIFQISQVYRDNEQGSLNSNEFSMLEFYRLGFGMHQLIDEVIELLIALGHSTDVEKVSYSDAFIQNSGIDILNTDFDDLKSIAKSHGLNSDFHWIEDLQTLLFVHLIEPKIAQIPICIIYDYPKDQAALAQINGSVAQRFELYINGVEIANGYQELQSREDYRFRFNNELIKRKKLSKITPLIDKQFLNELKDGGLPYCSGVAIGIERLFSAKSL